ncbi:MAG TPA: MarR family transcriptional regulator [Lapillicoccus sp.]|nr:MarR family transcriptional regulator [Lapillicoccus sp.]
MSDRHNLVGELGSAMQRYQRSVQAFDDAVGRQLGLGPADLRCLDWLADGPKTAGQLAQATALTPAATTALVDRLARKGLVERYRGDADRRQVLVRMTDQGVAETMRFYGPLVEEGQHVFDDLSDRELRLMRGYLESITALTERHRDRIDHTDHAP